MIWWYRSTLCEEYPYPELFRSVFSLIWTEYEEIRSITPYSVQTRENTDQNNSEYGHFLRSANHWITKLHKLMKRRIGNFRQFQKIMKDYLLNKALLLSSLAQYWIKKVNSRGSHWYFTAFNKPKLYSRINFICSLYLCQYEPIKKSTHQRRIKGLAKHRWYSFLAKLVED